MTDPRPRLTRVLIRDFKSIAECKVELRPLTILVGRNAAGKSNFVDALRFVADALNTSLRKAMSTRGGSTLFRRLPSGGRARGFEVALQLELGDSTTAEYGFSVADTDSESILAREKLLIREGARIVASYSIEDGRLTQATEKDMPPVSPEQLYLVRAASSPAIRPVLEALSNMEFYHFDPHSFRGPREPDAGGHLQSNGANLASVIRRLERSHPQRMERIGQYLQIIAPGFERVEAETTGPWETLRFLQTIEGSNRPLEFYAQSMSDGTLRALASLVAVHQAAVSEKPLGLVAIEEPETAIHPAAAAVLMDAFHEAILWTPILLTSHAPEILDQIDLETDALLVAESLEGSSRIARVDEAGLSVVQDHLFSAGDLLRMDQLKAEVESPSRAAS